MEHFDLEELERKYKDLLEMDIAIPPHVIEPPWPKVMTPAERAERARELELDHERRLELLKDKDTIIGEERLARQRYFEVKAEYEEKRAKLEGLKELKELLLKARELTDKKKRLMDQQQTTPLDRIRAPRERARSLPRNTTIGKESA